MTGESTVKNNDINAPDDGNRDNLLQLLCSFARFKLRIPITLYASGVIVTGMLIRPREYLEKWVTIFGGSLGEEFENTLRDSLQLREPEPDAGDDDHDPLETKYIHLDDARIFAPGQIPAPSNGVLWRGKLVDVSGFSLGSFEVSQ